MSFDRKNKRFSNSNSEVIKKQPDLNSYVAPEAQGESNKIKSRLFVNLEGQPARVFHDEICSNLQSCGSCDKIGASYKEILKLKKENFQKQLQEKIDIFSQAFVSDCGPSPLSLAYRHTAKLVVDEDFNAKRPTKGAETKSKRWINIGLYSPQTHRVIDIGSCPVQTDLINNIVGFLRSAIWRHEVTVYNPRKHEGLLRYVILRQSCRTHEILVTFVTTTAEKTQTRALARNLCERFPGVQGVIQHVNNTRGNAIFNFQEEEQQIPTNEPNIEQVNNIQLAGREYIIDEIIGLKLRYSNTSFMQNNPLMAEKAYFRIDELSSITKNDEVLDLYCGVGPIGLLLAKKAKRMVGIEENAVSIADARYNAKINDINNADFYSGKAEDILQGIIEQKIISNPALVTLNPSRRGCQKNVLDLITQLNPRSIVYMSCNASTLIRDLEILHLQGYSAVRFELFDMFPYTSHYEVIALCNKVG